MMISDKVRVYKIKHFKTFKYASQILEGRRGYGVVWLSLPVWDLPKPC